MNSAIVIIEVIQLIFFMHIIKQFFCLGLEIKSEKRYYLVSLFYLSIKLVDFVFSVFTDPIQRVIFNIILISILCFVTFGGMLYRKIIFILLFITIWLLTEIIFTFGALFMKITNNTELFISSITMIVLFIIVQALDFKAKKNE